MDNSPFWQVVKGRRSVRYYRPEPVPAETIGQILEATIQAPSAHNRQPWRFVVITAFETKDQLAKAMGERFHGDLAQDGLAAEEIKARVSRSYARITGAPCVIVVCLTMADMDRYPDARRTRAERIMGIQSVAMAGQNLLLAAHALGLGACWMCAPLFCPDTVAKALSLPPGWEAQGLITLGYPGGHPEGPGREALATRVIYR